MEKLKQNIDRIFQESPSQSDALLAIYELFVPEFPNAKKLKGYPSIGDEGWKYICKKFMQLDQKYHPEVMAGGLWMNKGFSVDRNLKGFQISMENCALEY